MRIVRIVRIVTREANVSLNLALRELFPYLTAMVVAIVRHLAKMVQIVETVRVVMVSTAKTVPIRTALPQIARTF
jgi:hypothetical protein